MAPIGPAPRKPEAKGQQELVHPQFWPTQPQPSALISHGEDEQPRESSVPLPYRTEIGPRIASVAKNSPGF